MSLIEIGEVMWVFLLVYIGQGESNVCVWHVFKSTYTSATFRNTRRIARNRITHKIMYHLPEPLGGIQEEQSELNALFMRSPDAWSMEQKEESLLMCAF
jgi:hypothetical protein